MASNDHNLEERQVDSAAGQQDALAKEKAGAMHTVGFHEAATSGHLATDK